MANGKPIGNDDQRARFIEAARELGADEDEATLKAKLGVIARQKVRDDGVLASSPDKPDRK